MTQLLELRAKARPLGTARVKLRLVGVDGGTLVRMTGNPDGLTAPLSLNRLVQLVTKVRNVESPRLDVDQPAPGPAPAPAAALRRSATWTRTPEAPDS